METSKLEFGITQSKVQEFKKTLRGQLILAGDGEYEQARRVWNAMIDKRPAMIVRPTGASDVLNCVKFARESNLLVAVRGGGHNVAGFGTCDGGMVIDFSRMKSIRVDPVKRLARAEPGLNWAEFDAETQAFGLAVPGGLVSTTGIAGFTLGGGIGWLSRKYGLTLDNLLSVDVVTADGRLVTASMDENTDLFWGIRGGGGNFGVVTSFEYTLHPVGPLILGGLLAYPVDKAGDLLRFYRDFVKNVPDDLNTLPAPLTAPKAPIIPQEYQGKQLIAIALCHSGKVEEGEKLVRPLREFAKPVVDFVKPMPYRVLQSLLELIAAPGFQNYWKSAYLAELRDEAIDTILAFNSKITSPLSSIHLIHMGGALRRVGEDATAFGHRDAAFVLNIVTRWEDPKESEKHMTWTREFFDAMQRFSSGGVYVNFLGEEGHDRVKAAYGPSKYKKLVELKRKYDPSNLFRINQNIPP